MTDVLGLDIGGVIMDGVREDHERQLDPPAIPGAFAAVALLQRERFQQRCWLVSRCRTDVEAELLNWLERRQFFQISGIYRERVIFCRAPSDKVEICRKLKATHFVDDRFEVLKHMIGVVPNLYRFQSRASRLEAEDGTVQGIRTIHTWAEITDNLLPSDRVQNA